MQTPKWPLQQHVIELPDPRGGTLTITLTEEIGYRATVQRADGVPVTLQQLFSHGHRFDDLSDVAKRALILYVHTERPS